MFRKSASSAKGRANPAPSAAFHAFSRSSTRSDTIRSASFIFTIFSSPEPLPARRHHSRSPASVPRNCGPARDSATCYDRSFMIALNHVSKVFDGKRKAVALDDIQLEIAKGQVVSIVGPSGSGKSTLLNLIGGLDRPSSGQIQIDGENLAELSDDDLTRVRRDKIGFVFPFFNLLPH